MKFIVSVIDQYVDDPRRQSNNRETVWWKKFILIYSPSSGRYMGDYLRNLFLFTKICYFLNVIAQIAMLSSLLGQPFYSLGFTVIRLLYEGKGWDFTSRYFPKVTLWYDFFNVNENRSIFLFFSLLSAVIFKFVKQMRCLLLILTPSCVFYRSIYSIK